MKKKCSALDFIAALLVFFGALNWGLVGVFHFDLVQAILGTNVGARVVYTLIALCGIYQFACQLQNSCCKKSCS